ncbi:YggT family protein [Arthrobacter zhaoguopingii]|uniref:YggT family protein n=1 Tax=Arthrobacter zhaoguopingii TaxID=2681491 RepID=UPI000E718D4A|nr:YggT family protein [Arthrobacter zhaoguopingii]RJT95878.1 YggT family protein [Arthrobacter frigidicola]
MSLVFALIYLVLMLFQLALIIRIIYDAVQIFARSWRPQKIALVVASGIYAVTDPPIKALRRVIPPLRIGGVSLDLAFLVLFFAVVILMGVSRGFATA